MTDFTRTSEFKQWLSYQIDKYKYSKNRGISFVIQVLTTSLSALGVWCLLETGRLLHMKRCTQASEVYFKHFKRCCLIELWAVTETRIREIAEERELQVKGRDTGIRELITEARKMNRNSVVEKFLRKAESKLGSKFIEFPSYLSAILKMFNFNKEEIRDWRCFLTYSE